jgi:hypothetical protein
MDDKKVVPRRISHGQVGAKLFGSGSVDIAGTNNLYATAPWTIIHLQTTKKEIKYGSHF